MANLNFFDLITRNGNDALTGLVEDVPTYAPEFSQVPVILRAGTNWKTLERIALPAAQFRLANQSLSGSKSTYKQLSHEMFFLDVPIVVDELIYKGDDGVTGDVLYQEGQGALQSAIITLGNQFYYGTSTDGSNGFVGVRSQLYPNGASGITPVTASSSATSSTAYGLVLRTDGVSFAVGKNGNIDFPPFQRQFVGSPGSTGTTSGFWAWVSNISCFVGLSVASEYAVFGITGITPSTPMTDKLAAQLIATVPLTKREGFTWFVNRSTYAGLQNSRTAINYQPAGARSGTPAVSPPPLEVEGYRIVLTDSITNTENNS